MMSVTTRNSGAATNPTMNISERVASVSRNDSCSDIARSMYFSDSSLRKSVTSPPESSTERRSSRNCSMLSLGVRFRAFRSAVNTSLPNRSMSRTTMSNSLATSP